MAKILFQMSGSIAAYKACHVISRLVQAGCEVQVVATPSALEFVGRATLEGLTGRPVHSETFAPSAYMSHIHLIRWADIAVLCPATANTLNKLASGIGDDLLTTLFLAHDFKKPFLIAPAMNVAMFHHPTTQDSIRKLREWGVELLDTAIGQLACGEIGEGKLLDPDQILKQILARMDEAGILSQTRSHALTATTNQDADETFEREFVSTRPSERLRVLVTAGGTKVPIDSVRSITNTSSGLTGAVIAEYLSFQGHDVTYLHAEGAIRPEQRERLETMSFVTFSDLENSLRRVLNDKYFDAVFHLAAVSDYDLAAIEIDGRAVSIATFEPAASNAAAPSIDRLRKIDSGENITLRLSKNPKLLPQLKSFSQNKELIVVGFKLTSGAEPPEKIAAIKKMASNVDLVVHNDLREISTPVHVSTLYEREHTVGVARTKTDLAVKLEHWLQKKVAKLSSGQLDRTATEVKNKDLQEQMLLASSTGRNL